jgi:cell division protein FtsB
MNIQRIFRNAKTSGQFVKVILSIGLSVGLILFTGLVVLDTLNSFSSAYQKAMIVREQQGRVSDLRLENLRKQQELGYVLGKEFVEDEAREKFSYVKKGEVIFILPDSGEVVVKRDESDASKTTATRPIDDWVNLLFK